MRAFRRRLSWPSISCPPFSSSSANANNSSVSARAPPPFAPICAAAECAPATSCHDGRLGTAARNERRRRPRRSRWLRSLRRVRRQLVVAPLRAPAHQGARRCVVLFSEGARRRARLQMSASSSRRKHSQNGSIRISFASTAKSRHVFAARRPRSSRRSPLAGSLRRHARRQNAHQAAASAERRAAAQADARPHAHPPSRERRKRAAVFEVGERAIGAAARQSSPPPCRDQHVHLENLGSHDIVDGNSRLTLGLIWTIILRFQIQVELCQNARARA